MILSQAFRLTATSGSLSEPFSAIQPSSHDAMVDPARSYAIASSLWLLGTWNGDSETGTEFLFYLILVQLNRHMELVATYWTVQLKC